MLGRLLLSNFSNAENKDSRPVRIWNWYFETFELWFALGTYKRCKSTSLVAFLACTYPGRCGETNGGNRGFVEHSPRFDLSRVIGEWACWIISRHWSLVTRNFVVGPSIRIMNLVWKGSSWRNDSWLRLPPEFVLNCAPRGRGQGSQFIAIICILWLCIMT